MLLSVPADNYEGAKKGLKGSLRAKKLIKEKYKSSKRKKLVGVIKFESWSKEIWRSVKINEEK